MGFSVHNIHLYLFIKVQKFWCGGEEFLPLDELLRTKLRLIGD